MALTNVLSTLVAVLALAATPVKADNTDVFNFATNLECLEVSSPYAVSFRVSENAAHAMIPDHDLNISISAVCLR